jgi:translocation and assembly module TamB
MRLLARALAAVGWAVLALLGLAGVALSAVAFLAAAPFTRPLVASTAIRFVNDAIAGRIELRGVSVLPQGGMELLGLEAYDPDGHLVVAVERARLSVDVTELRSRTVGVSLELEQPTVLIEQEADGGTSLARAFAPRRPAAPGAPPGGEGGAGWTLQVSRLALRGGDLWWKDSSGNTRAEATGIDLVARGTVGPRRVRAELRATGQLRSPVATPVSLELVASRAGDGLRVPVLRLDAGGTSLAAVGEGDLARRSGRLAVTRLGLSREQARAVLSQAPLGSDLDVVGYAEANGVTATAALRVEPVVVSGAGGRAEVAVALREVDLRRAAGFDVALDRLDPSRLAASLPAGAVTLAGHGAAAGRSLEDLRARLTLAVSRSRLGRGELTRADLGLRISRGTVELERLSATAPGAALDARGRWRRGGPVSGNVTVDAPDLALAARNGALLAGVPPPAIGGRARLEALVSGTADAPAVSGRLDAATLRAGTVALDGVHLALRGAGPRDAASGEVEGRIAAVRSGGVDRVRQATLRAALAGSEGEITVTASVPGAGTEPLTLDARGEVDRARARLELRRLALSYPGARWALVRPAVVDLGAPAVDRLELADPPQRLAIEGGVRPRATLAARVELSRVDLARLPPGLVPGGELRGELSGQVDATGPLAHPAVAGRLSLEQGGYGHIGGLEVAVDGRWDGEARRVAGTLFASRAAGGTLDADVELPLPLVGRPAEPVRARVRAAGISVSDLVAETGRSLFAEGTLGLELRVVGTAGAPSATAELTLADGAWEDLDGLGATVTVEAPGARAHVLASGTLGGRPVVSVDASAPLDLGDLVARPAETLRALRGAHLQATASILSLDLAAISGRAGVPPDLAGIVEAHVEMTGTPEAPRGRATAALTGVAAGAWRGVGATLEASAGEAGLAASGRVTVAGDEALRLQGSLALRPERLGDQEALATAALRVDAEIPRVALARAAGQALPLEGTLEGHVSVSGTLRAPEVRADLSGGAVAVKGRPLGDATVSARYARGRGEAEASLHPPSGGALHATLALRATLGLGAGGPPLADAPAEATLVADRLDLGFLPAVAPGVIRTAAGTIELDLKAAGPLRRLSPRGTVHLADGRLALSELGEWTDVALDVKVTDDAVELSRLEVRRGRGTLSAHGAARGLRGGQAKLQAKVDASSFTISRAGMEVATFDLNAEATGSWSPSELSVEVTLPRAVVRLPKRTPRTLQTLEARKDISIGRKPERRAEVAPAPAGPTEAAEKPLVVRAHLVSPGKFFVKSDDPRIDVELRADVQYEREDGGNYLRGSVEVVHGQVEPIGGRNFVIDRGVVRFTNGPPDAALLDVEAKYVNPAATVTAKITGTIHSPELKLTSSVPNMSDADIALFLLTGRTEAKAGGGGVGSVTGGEAGMAVVGVLATQAFKNLVQNKLPLDTVALEAGGFRAGKYVTDRIYIAYVRRWDADPTKYQNADEVRVEYQITPRWMFESLYGTAQTGAASLVWSRDY